jgi:hypothetical protein
VCPPSVTKLYRRRNQHKKYYSINACVVENCVYEKISTACCWKGLNFGHSERQDRIQGSAVFKRSERLIN